MKTVFVVRKYLVPFLTVFLLIVSAGFGFLHTQQRPALASAPLTKQISSDPFTNSTSQHQTQVEP
ncbi:MAG: hypothetical protein JOZ18_15560, partial [Chloroflexi bacterium]|nr:hypothetical protein [Chloroflexota bacterium]